jgi:hypothetical protein
MCFDCEEDSRLLLVVDLPLSRSSISMCTRFVCFLAHADLTVRLTQTMYRLWSYRGHRLSLPSSHSSKWAWLACPETKSLFVQVTSFSSRYYAILTVSSTLSARVREPRGVGELLSHLFREG